MMICNNNNVIDFEIAVFISKNVVLMVISTVGVSAWHAVTYLVLPLFLNYFSPIKIFIESVKLGKWGCVDKVHQVGYKLCKRQLNLFLIFSYCDCGF